MGLLSYKVYGDYLSIVNGYSIKISGSQRFPVECELLQGRDTKLQPLTFTLLKKKEKDTQKTRTRTHKNHKCIFVESGVSRRRISTSSSYPMYFYLCLQMCGTLLSWGNLSPTHLTGDYGTFGGVNLFNEIQGTGIRSL